MQVSDAVEHLTGANRHVLTLKEPAGREEGLKFSFDVMCSTPEHLDGLDGAWRTLGKEDADFTEQKDALVNALLGLGLRWGDEKGRHLLMDGDKPVPADRDGLRRTPVVILNAAVSAILEYRRPNEGSQPS